MPHALWVLGSNPPYLFVRCHSFYSFFLRLPLATKIESFQKLWWTLVYTLGTTAHAIRWSLIITTTLTFYYGRTNYISPLSANFLYAPHPHYLDNWLWKDKIHITITLNFLYPMCDIHVWQTCVKNMFDKHILWTCVTNVCDKHVWQTCVKNMFDKHMYLKQSTYNP